MMVLFFFSKVYVTLKGTNSRSFLFPYEDKDPISTEKFEFYTIVLGRVIWLLKFAARECQLYFLESGNVMNEIQTE